MQKAKDLFFNKILKKKRFWALLIIIVVIVLILIFRPNKNVKNTVTDFVKYMDLKETVLATGQVISDTDLNLSFNSGGVVRSIKVKVGDKVEQGALLATLDQSSASAALTIARGALTAARARYERILEGATNEEITIAKLALTNAEKDLENIKLYQETLVKNAYNNLLNSTPEAVPSDGTSEDTAPSISGTYSLGKEGKIKINSYHSSGGASFSASGLTEDVGIIDTLTPQPIGNSGLYIKFPSEYYDIGITEWDIEIPNKKASNYLTNYNAYQSALKAEQQTISSAKALVDQRKAELALKEAKARPSDVDLALADITSAEGQLEQATATYNNTMIVAPLKGTITSIDIKPGELASALKPVITLQDVDNTYIEANINEANIANMKIGMPVDITFDAFGTDKIYKGNITEIDPASTLISGVVNYKVTTSLGKIENLRPGMTANMTVLVNEKDHVLVVPIRALMTNENGGKVIRKIINTKNKKFKEVNVTTGLEGDGGLIEITNGLMENDEFVVLIKTN